MPQPFTRPITRDVQTSRHGPLTVRFTAEGIYFRPKGRRQWVLLEYGLGYLTAAKVAAADAATATRRARRSVSRGLLHPEGRAW